MLLDCAEMRARLTRYDFVQLSRAQVQVVMRANDTDAQRAQRELPSLLQLRCVVEPHRVAAVDERDPASADHLADAAFHYERRILVDADAKELRVRGDHEKQPLKSAPLREVRVDDRIESKQAKAGPDVLLDEI